MNKNLTRYPAVSIVIPTWNGLYLLKESLDQVIKAKNTYLGECEVIIVDNGSMDRTQDVLVDYYSDVLIEKFDVNMGFGYACNRGAEIAEGELILFLNNDIYVKEDLLQKMVDSFMSCDNPFSICPETRHWQGRNLTDQVFSSAIKLSYDNNGELIQHWMVDNGKNIANEIEETAYGTGAVLLVDKYKFKEVGGFDSLYGLAYWEDVDICLKAWARGWGSYCISSIHAWHKISATAEKRRLGDLKKKQVLLNYIILQLIHRDLNNSNSKFDEYLDKFYKELEGKAEGERALSIFIANKIKSIMPEIENRRNFISNLKVSNEMRQLPMINPGKGWSSQPILAEILKN